MMLLSAYLKHTATVLAAVAVCFFGACSGESEGQNSGIDSSAPTLRALEVSTVISDSGVTRYRATTPEWLIYNNVKSPYWFFPNGLRIEQFDTHLETEANIYCDQAHYDQTLRLWRLDGNVKVTNRKGEKFETDQLVWDQVNAKVYSDKKIKIQQPNCIINGRGFVSNETMTHYEISHPDGIIPISD
ncbi:MAG: LPS export ABC transporter periplasmic protein LptC [Paludibacteraceae bacterium]|nr:LPS export ABC transporter periplasmic protein LptC [Paludibacteraceae bacterium]